MTEFVKTEVRGATGVITLDRPKALNSLNPEMARAIDETLKRWRDDDTCLLYTSDAADEVRRV